MLLVFNSTNETVQQEITMPLYYTGLTQTARIREQEGNAKTFPLGLDYTVRVSVTLPANGYTWLIIE